MSLEKPSQKVKKIHKLLRNMLEHLHYYEGDSPCFKQHVKDVELIEDFIIEHSKSKQLTVAEMKAKGVKS